MKRIVFILAVLMSMTLGSSAQFIPPCNLAPAAVVTYATYSPTNKASAIVLASGNLNASSSSLVSGYATIGVSSASTYPLVRWDIQGNGGDWIIGICDASINFATYPGGDSHGWGYEAANGRIWHSPGNTSWTVPSATDKVNFALNMTTGKCWIGLNGTWLSGGNPDAGTGAQITGLTGTIYPCEGFGFSGNVTANFGATTLQSCPNTTLFHNGVQ